MGLVQSELQGREEAGGEGRARSRGAVQAKKGMGLILSPTAGL